MNGAQTPIGDPGMPGPKPGKGKKDGKEPPKKKNPWGTPQEPNPDYPA